MSELNFNSISIEKLVTLIKPKQNQTERIISPQTFIDCWNSFIKLTSFFLNNKKNLRWAKMQLDQDRTVIIPNFAIITSGEIQSEDKERQIFIQLLDIFVTNNNLLFKRTPNLEKKYPTVKLNLTAIGKGAGVEQETAGVAIHTLVAQIKEIIIQANNCEIDLGQLGKFLIIDRMIQFAPLQQGKVSQIATKKTVQNLLEVNKAFQKQYDLKNSSLLKDNSSILQRSQGQQQSQPFDFQAPLESNKVRLEPLRGSLTKSIGKFAQTFQQSPTRKVFKSEEIKIIPEMLGAGTNPKALDCHNSVLATDAKNLMEANFLKPPYAKIRHPPILDRFQRTLASPICAHKYNLSVSSRIGTNYSTSSRRLYLDLDSKFYYSNKKFHYFRCIKAARLGENKVIFTANKELLQKTANMEEELRYIAGEKTQELDIKVRAKQGCYQRYQTYIQNEINIEYIAPIRQYWITDILDLIPAEFDDLEKGQVEMLIDGMLNDVNKYYYDSIRKSILDYVLKDEEEKMRIGIMEVFKQVKDYGERIYLGIEPDEIWKSHTNEAKESISQNLVICNKATLQMMGIWKNYESQYFLKLPSKQDAPMKIDEFIKFQEEQIQTVKVMLTKNWQAELMNIYQEELSQMDKNKRQAVLFFESNATMMANQIRSLITDSLIYYREFFRRFKKDDYKEYQKVVQDEPNPLISIQDAFLEVQLKDDEGHIVFADALENIKQDLLRIIQDFVETSHQFPRPDNNLARNEKTFISKVEKDDEVVMKVTNEIEEILDENLDVIVKALEIYEQYAFLLKENEKVKEFIDTIGRKRDEYLKEIQKYLNLYNEIENTLPFYIRMNLIQIDGVEIKKKFLQICTDLQNKLVLAVFNYIINQNKSIRATIQDLINKISTAPENEEKLVEIEQEIENIRSKEHKNIMNEFNDLCRWLYFMHQQLLYNIPQYPDDELKQIQSLSDQVHGMQAKVDMYEQQIHKSRDDLEKKLKNRKDNFAADIKLLYQQIEQLPTKFTDAKYQVQQANEQIEFLNKRLIESIQDMQDINTKEELLGQTQTEFPILREAQSKLSPLKKLWNLIRDFQQNQQQWQKETVVFKLNAEEIEKEVKQMTSTAKGLTLEIPKSNTQSYRLANEMEKDIFAFRQNIPLIKVMCNPGLKERHWDEIQQTIQFTIRGNIDTTLQKLIGINALQHIEKLDEISDNASKEFNIERVLDKMYEDWQPIECEIKSWKDTGTYVLGGGSVDEMQTLLDDQIVKTQTMKGSPYAKIFEERINEWEGWLNYTMNLIFQWIKVQQVWMYLEPIFSSPDIAKHLQDEAIKFQDVDGIWKTNMKKIWQNPRPLEFTKNRKLLENWIYCTNLLDIVSKGLNQYLEGKRANFPRFYFLSNDELLEILSEVKDPLRVQPHLKKCFEGIQKLKFDEEKKIHGMYSTEGEYIPFNNLIDTEAARGQVDEWLIRVERSMIESVQTMTMKCFKEYQDQPRYKWVVDRCGMAVLCISLTYWTQGAEEALIEYGVQGVVDYAKKCSSLLEDIVRLVRTEIAPLDRCTIEALIVLDVHARDVIQKLADSQVGNINHFDWQSQMRYYNIQSNIIVRIINAELAYNYEYLGNSARLVITPLTDRCYRTLCGAVHLNYGGAPEGPAGTGKTETVKDLAKALARQCVVFNCSDGLDYKAMGKFFKGLASTGAWSCFDEFNRIDLEVLSVIAQQIRQIQIARTAGLSEFIFEDTEIKLMPTCNVFITMNPGYAGRSELPDNLKALFRTVAMMVPDYSLIAQISLYSYGFTNAVDLARKIVATYKLCSEQLSSQKHYDYGMRAGLNQQLLILIEIVKSVLVAAGNLKRKYPDEDEAILMLRSINDVNLPKFLAYDLPLFRGITSDLFPSVEIPPIDYSSMLDAITEELEQQNLQKFDYFMEKVIQFYEIILVRHGLMVVGLPFSGKTSIIRTLAGALGRLEKKGLMNENKVQIITLNPKSINMKQLYGFSDEVTNEWTDGLLAVKFRYFVKEETDDRKWLHFDGPVDAVWIENMNTVLDDNKKLCLNSGEIIAMAKTMNMIFEPMDLLVASPATVSRCGMIYMEPDEMGWRPMYQRWILTMPNTFKEEELQEVELLFEWTVDTVLKFLRRKCQEISPTQDINLVQTLMKIFRILLKDLEDEKWFPTLDQKIKINLIDSKFAFALIWSLGASVTTDFRKSFDLFVKKVFSGDIKVDIKGMDDSKKKKVTLPDRGLLYDYIYQLKSNRNDGEWLQWVDLIDIAETIPNNANPHQIIIKTADTMRYSFLLKTNISNEIPTLFCGPTGTGKSVYIKNVLLNDLPKDEYSAIEIIFSAQTSESQTQDIIDGKLERIRKGIFGPKKGKCILFVDDLNMPQKEVWGAQPPIEFLRQFISQGGWYDLKDKEKSFKQIVNVQFISAMGEPGGGRTFITPRILRHMNLVSLTSFDDENLNRIFQQILQWFFQSRGFSQEIVKSENKIVSSTLDVYRKAMSDLLPTPQKAHYTFNLRDFSKVILGICMADKETIQQAEQIVRLWVHEVWRVFCDRLINDEDRLLMLGFLRETVRAKFGLNFDNVFAHLDKFKDGKKDGKVDSIDEIRGLMFTDIQSSSSALKRPYEEILEPAKLQESVDKSLENYNYISEKPMDIVLFQFAIEHLLIISRILKQPGGNALLVGVGGSGRQSLTRLATSISDYQVFQIEISKQYGMTEWHDDIKKIMIMAGGKNQPTVFLFTDSQIKSEGFVEDINNLLNTGEIPNIFPMEEKVEVCEMVRAESRTQQKALDGTPQQLYSFFIDQVKKNLHIVLCFSPIGDNFRTRVRMFPSLVNCCTIDWFSEWPQDALLAVAKKFFNAIHMEETVRESCVQMVQYFHSSTTEQAAMFWKKMKRKYYVTPTSYIEMIITFKNLLEEKRNQVQGNKYKYENGHQKIISTEATVGDMQENLIQLQPKLKVAAEETAKKVEEVAVEKEAADKLKEEISKEEAIVQVAVNEAQVIQDDCQQQLDEAMPALLAAENALSVLDKSEIDKVKKMPQPPIAVKNVLQACCYLLNPNPTQKKKNMDTLKMETDWWAASVQMISDMNFMKNLYNYDKDNIPEKNIQALGAFIKDPEIEKTISIESVEKASTACKCIIQWVIGIYNFHFVNKKVKPKKEQLAQAEEKVKKLNATLSAKQKQLKAAVDKVTKLNEELMETERNKKKLEQQYEDCSKQLERAKTLIENLGGEKGRWYDLAQQLDVAFNNLTGDILISSGMIAYLGPFTSLYRSEITKEWVDKNLEMNIPSSEQFSLLTVLGDPVKIRQWNIQGLPSDSFSIENGIVVKNTRRWPLCIDPQGQANKWIKRMEKERKLEIIKLSYSTYLRTLENCIQFGRPVLLENVLEDLDPSLEPILLKQLTKKGTTLYLKLGDQTIEFSRDFYFYITTKLRNPHYLPEISTKVTLLNFMITPEGLNDQLLGILVSKERPDLEAEKERLIVEGAENKRELKEIEDKILEVLSSNKNILTDETAINILTASKEKSNEISEKQQIAEETEKNIDEARQEYKCVSQEAATLFFCISDLANIDPMYQYSLTYFIDLFTMAIINSEQATKIDIRLENLKKYFLYSLYCNICRSLFEKDKLLFSFLLAIKLLEFKGELNQQLWRFLLTGGISLDEKFPAKPENQQWVSDKMWTEICRFSQFKDFENFNYIFSEQINQWKVIYDSIEPQEEKFPGNFSMFQKLIIIRSIRPDKLVGAVQSYVSYQLGPQFIDPPTFDLSLIYKDSTAITPLIFVLSPGSDPFASLNSFANTMNKSIQPISLGQGQGPVAENMIKQGQEHGWWVVLQNCHLAISWMPTLEKICEEFAPEVGKINNGFRLWLTSYPSPQFPTAILQSGVKMTNEPPKGLKSNLQGSYLTDPIKNAEFFDSCQQPREFKRILYGLCFFHAVIQERRKFGALGWNIAYEFNESDLRICVQQLKMFLDENDDIPFAALKYLTGECNYGGRVTDDKDRRLIITILNDYYCDELAKDDNYKFTENDIYRTPSFETHSEYYEFVKKMPINTSPEVLGFHPNADITKDLNETNLLLDSILLCSTESESSEGQSMESVLKKLGKTILNDFPEQYNAQEALAKYPVIYTESMNTVLTQELDRFNGLIKIIRSSLKDIDKAMQGLILMSPQLEKACRQLFDGKVPDLWMDKSYPSLKPLGSYIADLKQRLKFFQNWLENGQPPMFWISGFFFTQSFLTGVLQNYARKYTIPIDEIVFDFEIISEEKNEKPEDGAYIYGLFIEGAKWDEEKQTLDESDPKVLFVKCPHVQLSPCHYSKLRDFSFYDCPVYKTSVRRGVLSTTGHSTNFVMMIRLPSQLEQKHWIKRGVALLTQLDD